MENYTELKCMFDICFKKTIEFHLFFFFSLPKHGDENWEDEDNTALQCWPAHPVPQSKHNTLVLFLQME